MFLAELEAHLLEFELLDFARASQRELVDEEDVLRNLVTGNLATAEQLDILGGHLDSLLKDDEGTYGLTVFLGGNGSHLHIADARHVVEELFDFTWIDILTAADDHVLDTARDFIEALLVFDAEVARVEVAVFVDDLSGGCRILIVALHHVEALAAHLTLYADGTLLTGLGIEHLDIYKRIVAAHRGATLLEGVVQTSLRHTR